MIVVFVFVRVHIDDEVFLIQRLTFLDKFYLFCIPISYQDVYYSGLHPNKSYLLAKLLVVVYYLFNLVDFFRQFFLHFHKFLQDCRIFFCLNFDFGVLGQ